MRTREPLTIPLPNTRLNSSKFVLIRGSSDVSIADIGEGFEWFEQND